MSQTDVPAPGSGSVDRAGAPADRAARPNGRRRRLTGRLRKTVLTIHVAAAVSLLGASAVLLVGGLWAATRDQPSEAHAVYAFLRLLTVSLDIPLAVTAGLAGLTLALTGWGILRSRWVAVKLAIYVATLTIGVTLIAPGLDTMREVTEVSSPVGSGERWRPVAAAGSQVVLLVTAVTFGVFKPWGRTPLFRGFR